MTGAHRRRGPEASAAGSPRGSRLRRWTANLALLFGLALAAAMVVPPLVGYERYVITGSSMTGSYDRGSIAYERPVPVEELEVGDVITYEPPARTGTEGLVTHRIIEIRHRGSSEPVFRTKGDANAEADPWRFSLSGPTQARAELSVPYAGYVFAALGLRWVRMLIIGLPALALAAALLAGLWREAGRAAEPPSVAVETSGSQAR